MQRVISPRLIGPISRVKPVERASEFKECSLSLSKEFPGSNGHTFSIQFWGGSHAGSRKQKDEPGRAETKMERKDQVLENNRNYFMWKCWLLTRERRAETKKQLFHSSQYWPFSFFDIFSIFFILITFHLKKFHFFFRIRSQCKQCIDSHNFFSRFCSLKTQRQARKRIRKKTHFRIRKLTKKMTHADFTPLKFSRHFWGVCVAQTQTC